ncbi:MAG: hypothetical protein Q8O43_02440 [Dehalococcoidia bacterium]|nr:hypothetical protein [Dehalococcoidia bacterium]
MHTNGKETTLEKEIKASLAEGYLPCAVAFDIARKLKIPPKAVGTAADRIAIRISNCQLGCFTKKKAVHTEADSVPVSESVVNGITTSLVNGYLPCATAFRLSRQLAVSRQEIGDGTNKLRVKITKCQLGCFG